MSRLRIRANAARKGPQPARRPRQVLARPNEQGSAQPMAPQGVYRRTRSDGAGLRPAEFVPLQRAVGNRRVQRMRRGPGQLQTKRSLWTATHSSFFEAHPRTIGAADPHGGVLQRAANYSTLDGTIHATVDDSDSPITMTGSPRQTETPVPAINGSLSYHEVTIPKAAVSDSIFAFFGTVRAFEISTFTAKPQGRRIGQLLAWHLARVAKAAGIGYITAGNVTAARGTFYTPLGFVDFKNAASWAALTARKAQLEQQMTGPAPPARAIAQEYDDVLEAMAENKIFISAADLETNAEQRWRQEWAPERR